jgi:anti-sigma factor RsiW
MNHHLTTAELDQMLFEAASATRNEHLATCPACIAELASLRSTFTTLRSTTTAASAQHQQLAARSARNSRTRLPVRLGTRLVGSFAAAAIALAIGLPIALHRTATTHPSVVATAHHPQATPADTFTPSHLSDEQLLTSVQGDLSASVPEPMLPLEDTTSTVTK